MGKGRFLLLLFLILCGAEKLQAQNDSLPHYGFSDYNEAADTLFARLMNKKLQPIYRFTLSENEFIAETRKTDTVVPLQMIHGQYLAYWSKAERSFKKVHKKLRKSRISAKRAVFDTVLVYKNSGYGDVIRTELYFYQKRYKAWVKFQLWEVNDLWYITGKFSLVEEKLPK